MRLCKSVAIFDQTQEPLQAQSLHCNEFFALRLVFPHTHMAKRDQNKVVILAMEMFICSLTSFANKAVW